MRRAVVLVLVGVLSPRGVRRWRGRRGGHERGLDHDARGEPIVIRTSVIVATTPGAEPIATGDSS